ncbi:MAG: pyridoxamine 5'-phosphate oxidase family protein [Candidatus Kariarchaeaceae archaeon]|jgi:nitroimidazol reductase NimA-like FMN-containing flavoprotein (pyridoxamine 5'-phosphate oxidase superfamily)
MRRNELASENKKDYEFIMQEAKVGHLGLLDENGFPRIIPLNFAAHGYYVYFHGALEGEKYDLLLKNPRAAFSVDIPYSFIPSYWQTKNYACPASHFFKSVHIRGKAGLVEDIQEKAFALQIIMEKYQPEGNYQKITQDGAIYKKALQEVSVFFVKTEEITVKIKFGQNENPELQQKIIEELEKRNMGRDHETANEMRKYLNTK